MPRYGSCVQGTQLATIALMFEDRRIFHLVEESCPAECIRGVLCILDLQAFPVVGYRKEVAV
jgi:hypothetical protein